MRDFIYLLIFWLISCGVQQVETEIKQQLKFSVADSLDKYSAAEGLSKTADTAYFVSAINSTEFGLIQYSDSCTVLYHKIASGWVATDTFSIGLSDIDITDINNDKMNDLVITYAVSASGANQENLVCLFDTETRQFMHNPNYDLPNIRYDTAKQRVVTEWFGVDGSHSKSEYIIIGDSLISDEK